MFDRDDVITVAYDEVGYLEKNSKDADLDDKTADAGDQNFTKYARDLDKIGYFNGRKQGMAWCSVFVASCFVTAYGEENARKLLYQPKKDNCAAGCRYARDYFKRNGKLFDKPEQGDVVFFYPKDGIGGDKIQHTGIVVLVDENYVHTIEGNTNISKDVVANGGGVWEKKYPLDFARFAGFGRPNWECGGISSVKEEDTVFDAIAVNPGAFLNIREKKSTMSKIIGKIPQGETCGVLDDSDNKWWKVIYKGYIGYCMTGDDKNVFLIKDDEQDNKLDGKYDDDDKEQQIAELRETIEELNTMIDDLINRLNEVTERLDEIDTN